MSTQHAAWSACRREAGSLGSGENTAPTKYAISTQGWRSALPRTGRRRRGRMNMSSNRTVTIVATECQSNRCRRLPHTSASSDGETYRRIGGIEEYITDYRLSACLPTMSNTFDGERFSTRTRVLPLSSNNAFIARRRPRRWSLSEQLRLSVQQHRPRVSTGPARPDAVYPRSSGVLPQ